MKKYLMIFVLIISFLLCLPSSVVETFASEVEDNDTYLLVEVEDNDTYFVTEYDPTLEGEEYKLNPNARSFEPNIVHYNLETQEVEYMYLNNSMNTIEQAIDSYTSYTQDLNGDGNPTSNGVLENDLIRDETPDFRIGKMGGSTAFLMGPNIALTAGHSVLRRTDDGTEFRDNLVIRFGYNDEDCSENLEEQCDECHKVSVTDVYVLKLFYDEATYANDWAICVIDERLGDDYGIFGKCTGYNLIGLDATIQGYPGGQSTSGQYISTGEIVKNYPTFKYFAYTCGGFSGSPVFVTINGNVYVAGIHTYSVSNSNSEKIYAGATRISGFLFDFLNYFLEENYRGVELRDYCYDGITKIRYNTMSELIVTPTDNMRVYLSTNGTSFENIPSQTKYFYTSTTTSTTVNYYYKYFKNYKIDSGTYSSIYNFNDYFTTQAKTAQYKIVDRTYTNDVIPTTFDQTDNIWYHNGSSGKIIKGTIAYNGYARNIEVTIPSSGTNLSTMVTINGTSFQLRTGPYRVSIIASQRLVCNDNIIFAFGVA